ncbi:MAG TPA: GIY-YIG nuclease family protein [Candidatus Paceibacterota bacterium]
MEDYFVYVLKSLRNNKRYIGYTSKDPLIRLKEHNSGASKFTSQNGPFKLTYTERYEDKSIAIKREKFLKSGQGRKFLDNMSGA